MRELTNEYMLELTDDAPMKRIYLNGRPYLERYFMGYTAGGHAQAWLHRFLSADAERHIHNHPFVAHSMVLLGWYEEEYSHPTGAGRHIREAMDEGILTTGFLSHLICDGMPGHDPDFDGVQRIDPFHWHRITEVAPETWTLLVVEPGRLPHWYFKHDDGGLTLNEAGTEDWYKRCHPRKHTPIVESAK